MKIGIIGSGIVGQTVGSKLVALGHDVVIGTRDPKKLDEKKNMAGSLRELRVLALLDRIAGRGVGSALALELVPVNQVREVVGQPPPPRGKQPRGGDHGDGGLRGQAARAGIEHRHRSV